MSNHGDSVPFFMESIGYNPEQEEISRPEGHPCFHWLQTLEGEGEIHCEGHHILLPQQHGLLFFPHTPHSYQAKIKTWSTYYLTFEGAQVNSILSSLGLHHLALLHWEEASPLNKIIEQILQKIITTHDVSGLDNSLDLYSFLISLKKYGETNNHPSIHSLTERMIPLLHWMEQNYMDPNIGVKDMSSYLHLSTRHINSLFKKAFGYTPYHYLVHLRIRKSKEILLNERFLPIQDIAKRIGFRDTSHYIATFRKLEGATPEKFRGLYTH